MFNCGKCGKTSKPGEKPVKEVLEIRPKTYYNGGNVSTGHETVREIMRHKECPAS